ncbi:MAG: hypothetical protein AB7P03_29000, partial [Kofleriaceae bacterium]
MATPYITSRGVRGNAPVASRLAGPEESAATRRLRVASQVPRVRGNAPASRLAGPEESAATRRRVASQVPRSPRLRAGNAPVASRLAGPEESAATRGN